jgi:hypothetical protein
VVRHACGRRVEALAAAVRIARIEGGSDSFTPRRVPGRTEGQPMTKKGDDILERIIAFNEAKGGGVVVQKAAKGYSLFREASGKPIARLRPTEKGDQVEVLWWSHRDKWERIGDFGVVLPFEEALKYVAKDPIGCFWS